MNVEVYSLAAVFCIAIVPIAAWLGKTQAQSHTVRRAIWSLWLIMPVVLITMATTWRLPVQGEQQRADRPIEEPTDGYVTSHSCQSCHPDTHASWHASYHRTMTQVASPETVVGDFNDVQLLSTAGECRLTRRQDEFWVDMPDPSWLMRFRRAELARHLSAGELGEELQRDLELYRAGKGQTDALRKALEAIARSIDADAGQRAPRIQRPILMTTGSHHYQGYWFPSGFARELGMLPFVYLIEEQRWIPREAAFLNPPPALSSVEMRKWNTGCIHCHTTRGQPRIAPHQLDSRAVEFGIACESCHGPGERHVAANRDPVRRYTRHLSEGPDPTIVHPARLSHRLSSQVCGQCHGVLSSHTEEQRSEYARNGSPYQPGEDLEKVRFLIRGTQKGKSERLSEMLRSEPTLLEARFWPDGMVRVSGREYNGLVETPCFQRGEMSCLSCHQMHQPASDPRPAKQWANDQLKPGMESNQACLQCHQDYRREEALTAHTHHAANSSGSSCYNCHMPHTTYGILKAIRSHQVDSPSVAVSLASGRPNACNLCHLDRTKAWTAEHLHDRYGLPKPQLSEDDQSVADSLLWLLRGDAGQRALIAWHMGWQPAREVSGSEWMGPFLSQLLEDPYDAVRFIAQRSLRRLPNFKDLDYDFVAPPEERAAARIRAIEIWKRTHSAAGLPTRKAVLIDPSAGLRQDEIKRLLKQRDDRPVGLAE